jgi:hypothetical protein
MKYHGTRRLKLGASIAWTKLVSMSMTRAGFKCSVVLARALIIVSSISPTSGHLMTDPMF